MPVVPTSETQAPAFSPSEDMLALAAGAQHNAELRSHTPTLRERITNSLSVALGDDRKSYRRAQMLTDALDLTPVGLATMAYDAGRGAGSPGGAAVGGLEVGAAIFAGPLARTANIRKLLRASEMERAGADADEVWYATGWQRGADDKWRFEIPDEASQFKVGPRRYQLARGFEHGELFAAYPNMSRIPVQEKTMEGYLGLYYNSPEKIRLAAGMDPELKRSVMLHELQHAVQKREGFARGGQGPAVMDEFFEKLSTRVQQLRRTGHGTEADELERLAMAAANKEEDLAPEVYRRLAGEVEALNVEHRMGWPVEWRSTSPPSRTERIPRSQQIPYRVEW